MKYSYYLISIILMLFATACVQSKDEQTLSILSQESDITVSEARSFYENDIISRANTESQRIKLLSPGDYTPQWDNAKMSQNSRIACVDVPIISTYRYRAIRSEFSRGHANAYKVDVSQKLVIVKDRESGAMASYVMSLIPDKEFAAKHKGDISNIFLNANDRGKFSGTVLYTHYGIPVTVNKYIDGVYTDGATICGVRDDARRIQNFRYIVKSISNIHFKKCSVFNSRASEDDNLDEEDGDDWWDFDGEYIYIGGGLYADEDGNLYIDYNNDGEIDSIYIPPVDITPEDPGEGGGDDGNEPPTGQQDPPGDNGEGEFDEGHTGDGNDDNTDEYYESLGQMGLDKIRGDLESGNVQIKQATMSNGEAILSAFGLGLNTNGIITSCLNFMDKANVDKYATRLGYCIGGAGTIISLYQTYIVCSDGDITTGDALTAISAALGVAVFFLPVGTIAGIVGVSSCVIGLVSIFVTTNLPSEMHIQLENGTNVSIYIINNQISPIVA